MQVQTLQMSLRHAVIANLVRTRSMRTIAGIRQDLQPSTLRPIILRSLHVNYLSHAYKHLHDPYFVAGTALPDWMSVVIAAIELAVSRLRKC